MVFKRRPTHDYMPAEIERKFLLANDSWRCFVAEPAGTVIKQGYLSRDPERIVRIRLGAHLPASPSRVAPLESAAQNLNTPSLSLTLKKFSSAASSLHRKDLLHNPPREPYLGNR